MKTPQNSSVISTRHHHADLVVVGGGLAGLFAAIAAARHGASVILVQDRPVLGGNASSEIRMGIMGAHGDNNKETGLLEEIQLDNIYVNPLRRYTRWDDVLYSAVVREKNISLLLNTSVQSVDAADGRIRSVTAWNGNEYCTYQISGTYFADCSGDGILRLGGADFRIGREAPEEFAEHFTQVGNDDRTMGNSILLQLRRCAEHRPFIAPDWAYHFTEETIPKNRPLNPDNNNFWWIEYGGNIDTVGDANVIAFELKRIAYGVWEYMKNHPDGRCRNYELDWIGSLPGKRESCRFIGDHLLTQNDIMNGGIFPDVVCYGGWTLDDHHPDAFFNNGPQSLHHKPPTPFGIPYRCFYSRNIDNLFFAGRNISCTHMGMSATRVMATCALMGQAVGTAAALCHSHECSPRDIGRLHLAELQNTLEDDDVMLPGRWRQIPAVTRDAQCSHDVVRDGIDRNWQGQDHGAWVATGEAITLAWPTPQTLTACRVVFDSELNFQGKRMLKLEALDEFKPMPAMLTKRFHIDMLIDDQWRTVISQEQWHHRLFRQALPQQPCRAIRLVVDETWGGSEQKAHVFAYDVR
ncbi:MAG: FAD-dependent oxidoreductase [Lentisphaeria bacterium]|nr:FAD-dependent oxidoreductase [Lentisphaeria bacterium]